MASMLVRFAWTDEVPDPAVCSSMLYPGLVPPASLGFQSSFSHIIFSSWQGRAPLNLSKAFGVL